MFNLALNSVDGINMLENAGVVVIESRVNFEPVVELEQSDGRWKRTTRQLHDASGVPVWGLAVRLATAAFNSASTRWVDAEVRICADERPDVRAILRNDI